MKKITLSAAVLALAMMGCSDSGLDNSVASTSASEVKAESAQQTPSDVGLLAKSANWPTRYYVEQKDFAPASQYYTFPQVGIQLKMNTYAVNDDSKGGFYGVGEFNVTQFVNPPDYMRVITLPFYNCRMNPSLTCDNRGFIPNRFNYLKVKQDYDVSSVKAVTDVISRPHNSNWSSLSNSISYCIAVWNKGQWNQVILAGTVFNGNQFKNDRYLAEQAYNQIFVPAINDWCVNHLAECQALDQ